MRPLLHLMSLALISATPANAEPGGPGAHFVENWNLNGDGYVTLAEATERRADIFLTFDADENGVLDAEEHDLFDEARANDMADNGMGQGKGRNNPANGMLRNVTDADGKGEVSRQEFMDAVPTWFAKMDRNGDGTVSVEDY